eukprot:3610723-Prymnesium_polylepis.1
MGSRARKAAAGLLAPSVAGLSLYCSRHERVAVPAPATASTATAQACEVAHFASFCTAAEINEVLALKNAHQQASRLGLRTATAGASWSQAEEGVVRTTTYLNADGIAQREAPALMGKLCELARSVDSSRWGGAAAGTEIRVIEVAWH